MILTVNFVDKAKRNTEINFDKEFDVQVAVYRDKFL